MLNEIRARDYLKANDALQMFFDWIAVHSFEKCTPTMLVGLDKEQRILKYGLLIRACLARNFGYM